MKDPLKTYLYIEKKSKFYSFLFSLENLEEVENILKELKENNKDARHICYAYTFKGQAKFSDDNEPKGTAGKPIYQVLDRKHIDALIVVIRYFGGTKLGASHLLRAYVKAASEVIN